METGQGTYQGCLKNSYEQGGESLEVQEYV